jgi:hypothetical protein
MNTTENNKLIAEFMGWKLGHPELLELRWSDEWFDGRDKKTTKGFLHFDTDWNWLMEVVEKIESLCSNRGFEISARFVHIRVNNNLTISSGVKDNRIEAVYNVCIEFIKWYNQQK